MLHYVLQLQNGPASDVKDKIGIGRKKLGYIVYGKT
jgi:hypothetical protein